MSVTATLLGVGLGAATAAGVFGLAVPNLPEPAAEAASGASPAWVKPSYRSLVTPGRLATASVLGGCAGGIAAQQPAGVWPLLLVLAGPAAALVLVDALTTYLPLRLTRWCWLLAGLAMAAMLLLPGAAPGALLLRWLVAGGATAAIFWLVWRLGAGLGFGDVRLAPLVAVAAASDSWPVWPAALLYGTALGALWGVVTAVWRRHHPHPLGTVFPYGPSLWLGLWPALLLG